MSIRKPQIHWRAAAALVLATAVVGPAVAKPAKKKPPAPPPSDLPADLNVASLRVGAMQTLYELDASPEQLHLIRKAAAGSGVRDTSDRPPAKGADKLAKALSDLREALVDPKPDDAKIAAARNALADATGEADVTLDDAVHPSAAAVAAAVTAGRAFTAGQLAAYLAAHADQVVGPAERLTNGLAEVRDAPPDGLDAAVKQVSVEVGQLAAGPDAPAAADAVAAKAADWLRANRANPPAETTEERSKVEAAARTVVGSVPPVEGLGHWFDIEMAQLLANPQLPEAVDALLAKSKEP